MVSAIYEQIGRFVVSLVWMRFGRQVKIAGGAFAALVLVGGYLLASRQPPEG